ncbi:MAG TPA: hypothetical protein VHB21_26885, partial [Minicystis sp.]|nr:hypothetical protein [Minicystis sp.]
AARPPGRAVSSADDAPRGLARLRRFAPVVLVAGVVASGALVLPKLPKSRDVELRVADPETVTAVEVAWAEDGSPIQGASWRFEPGHAPRTLSSTLKVPDGRYDVDISVRRSTEEQTSRRSVELRDTDHVTLRVP